MKVTKEEYEMLVEAIKCNVEDVDVFTGRMPGKKESSKMLTIDTKNGESFCFELDIEESK